MRGRCDRECGEHDLSAGSGHAVPALAAKVLESRKHLVDDAVVITLPHAPRAHRLVHTTMLPDVDTNKRLVAAPSRLLVGRRPNLTGEARRRSIA